MIRRSRSAHIRPTEEPDRLMPTPSSTARALLATGVLLGTSLTASACTGGGTAGALPHPAASTSAAVPLPAPSATPSATPSAAPTAEPTTAQLAAALPSLPGGARPWPTAAPTGPLTQRQFTSAEFGADKVAKYLPLEQQFGLRFGAGRGWRNGAGVTVEVLIGEYRDRTGATTVYQGLTDGDKTVDGGDSHFTLTGAPDSFGISDPTPDSHGDTTASLRALAGTMVLEVTVTAPAVPDQATAKSVAAQTYAKLCKLTDCTAGSSS